MNLNDTVDKIFEIKDGENQRQAFEMLLELKYDKETIVNYFMRKKPVFWSKVSFETMVHILKNKDYSSIFSVIYASNDGSGMTNALEEYIQSKINMNYTVEENYQAALKWNNVFENFQKEETKRFKHIYYMLQLYLRDAFNTDQFKIAKAGLALPFYQAIEQKYTPNSIGVGYVEKMYEINKIWYKKGVFRKFNDTSDPLHVKESFNDFFDYIILKSDPSFFENYKNDLSFLYRVFYMSNYKKFDVNDFKNKYPEYKKISQKEQENNILYDVIERLKTCKKENEAIEDFSILENFSIESIIINNRNIKEAIFDIDFECGTINQGVYEFLKKITIESDSKSYCDEEISKFLKILLVITKMIDNDNNKLELSLDLPFPEISNADFISCYPTYTTKNVLDESKIKKNYAVLSAKREQESLNKILLANNDKIKKRL